MSHTGEDVVAALRVFLEQAERDAPRVHHIECDVHVHTDPVHGMTSALAGLRILHEVPGAVCDCPVPETLLADIASKRNVLDAYEADIQAKTTVDPDGYASYLIAGAQAVRGRLIREWTSAFTAAGR